MPRLRLFDIEKSVKDFNHGEMYVAAIIKNRLFNPVILGGKQAVFLTIIDKSLAEKGDNIVVTIEYGMLVITSQCKLEQIT